MASTSPNLLFIINPGSGNNATDWRKEIETFFKDKSITIEMYDLPNPCELQIIKDLIAERKPSKVIAVGGDGTVKLLAECLVNTQIPLGILPAGSANGMAKELNISTEPQAALAVIFEGIPQRIHLVKINNELSIHLSDIGFNAEVVKRFEDENRRGMWGYVKAAWRVLRQHSEMLVEIKVDEEFTKVKAAMVVIANATQYGNGVVINPDGSLFDDLFGVVIIKKISLTEIFKMRFTQKNFNEEKTTFFQTRLLRINSSRKVHFQVDGEYKGKVNKINAEIIPDALSVIIPPEEKT
jgi:diacylglycerol kinase (ATP)